MYNWIKAGCPRDRLNIGIPGYGRAFQASGDDPLKAYGQPGGVSSISSPYLGETGLLAYYEVGQFAVSWNLINEYLIDM
jgi:GH18 family chitinase